MKITHRQFNYLFISYLLLVSILLLIATLGFLPKESFELKTLGNIALSFVFPLSILGLMYLFARSMKDKLVKLSMGVLGLFILARMVYVTLILVMDNWEL